MMLASCCVRTANHQCDLILVYGDTLRVLLRCIFVDSGIWKHFDGPLDTEITYFCKDDLVSHLRNMTDRDHLEEFLSRLLEIRNLEMEVSVMEEIRDDATCLSPIAMEYGPDGDPFRDTSDQEPLLPKGTEGEVSKAAFQLKYGYDSNPFDDSSDTELISLKSSTGEGSQSQNNLGSRANRDSFEDFSDVEILLPQRQAEVGTKSFRSRLPSISLDTKLHSLRKFTAEKRSFGSRFPSISLGRRPRLRWDYQRLPSPSRIPECPPSGDCSTCKKCKEAVECEW